MRISFVTSRRPRKRQFDDFPRRSSAIYRHHEGYLRQLVSEGKGPPPPPNGRRTYSVEDIVRLRRLLDQGSKGARRYVPHRRDTEALQVISVMNFKGGSGKTTTAAHLAQYLAFRGYRVLAIDLDPQASLSTLFGHQPELDVGENETIYGAIRYDADRREMPEIVRGTYIPNLHIVPGQLELMEFEHETPEGADDAKQSDYSVFRQDWRSVGPGQRCL